MAECLASADILVIVGTDSPCVSEFGVEAVYMHTFIDGPNQFLPADGGGFTPACRGSARGYQIFFFTFDISSDAVTLLTTSAAQR